MPFFILGSTKNANVVLVLEGDGPTGPAPGDQKACLLYDTRHEINLSAETQADEGDASGVFKLVDFETTALVFLEIVENDNGITTPETAFVSLHDIWKWVREQHGDHYE